MANICNKCCLLVCLLLSACSMGPAKTGPIPRPAPLTKFFMIEGDVISTGQLRGKPAVVVFWASWCPHSRSVLQKLDRLAERYGAPHKVRFIAVSIDKQEAEEQLNSSIRVLGLQRIEHAFSGNDVYDEAYIRFLGDTLPHIFVVNAEGTIVAAGGSAGVVKDFLE